MFSDAFRFAGVGINLSLTSLVVDMSFAVERLEQESSHSSESDSAFTEAYAVVDVTFGAGTVFGPLISGLLYEKTSFAITYGVLAGFCFSGSLPVVSCYLRNHHTFEENGIGLLTSLLQMLYTGHVPPKKHHEPDA